MVNEDEARQQEAATKTIVCLACGRTAPVSTSRCICGRWFPTLLALPGMSGDDGEPVRKPQSTVNQGKSVPLPDGRTGREDFAFAGMACGLISSVMDVFFISQGWPISLGIAAVAVGLSWVGMRSKDRRMSIIGIATAGVSIAVIGLFALQTRR